jgi:hypothetical protein
LLQFQQRLEAKEDAGWTEWTARLVEERAELERQLAEEKVARAEAAASAVAAMAEERRSSQQKIDALLEKKRNLMSEKERLDKNFRKVTTKFGPRRTSTRSYKRRRRRSKPSAISEVKERGRCVTNSPR